MRGTAPRPCPRKTRMYSSAGFSEPAHRAKRQRTAETTWIPGVFIYNKVRGRAHAATLCEATHPQAVASYDDAGKRIFLCTPCGYAGRDVQVVEDLNEHVRLCGRNGCKGLL